MNLALTDEQDRFHTEAEGFAREHVAPEAARIDEAGLFPSTVIGKAASRGYLGMRVPQERGLLRLDHVSSVLPSEAHARARPPPPPLLPPPTPPLPHAPPRPPPA